MFVTVWLEEEYGYRYWRWDTGIKKAANAARAGTLALAAFVSRPQAEAQIGAYRDKSYITQPIVSTHGRFYSSPVAAAEHRSPLGKK